jgi:hypothetical protein
MPAGRDFTYTLSGLISHIDVTSSIQCYALWAGKLRISANAIGRGDFATAGKGAYV